MPNAISNILAKAFRRNDELDLSSATPSELAMMSRFPGTKERDYIEMRLGIPINRLTDFSSYIACGNKTVWATFRSCRIISSIAVSATMKVVRDRQGASDDVTRSYGWFVNKPNPYDSWEEIIEMWVFHMELVGNAYWLKDEPDLYGRPKAIYPLLPQHMRVVPDETTKVSKYIYHVSGREMQFDPKDIIHFKSTNPGSLVMGMGSVEPSESIYNNFINKNTLEEKFMENGAQPSGVLVREDAVESQPQWEALKRRFIKDYGGKKNAGKTAFLNGKWAYHKLGMSMNEMQALDREKWGVEQIFLNHGVPLSVAGIAGAANYATAKQDEINFRRYKVVPLIDLLVTKINSDGFFRAPNEGDLKLTYELSGLIDVEQIVKEYKPLVDVGAMTRNELREMVGLPLSDNVILDQFLVGSNLMPIEMVGFGDPEQAIEEELKTKTKRRPPTPKYLEQKAGLPSSYRPATNSDVPAGHACGTCSFSNEKDAAPDGRARCVQWGEYVEGGFVCNAWKGR